MLLEEFLCLVRILYICLPYSIPVHMYSGVCIQLASAEALKFSKAVNFTKIF